MSCPGGRNKGEEFVAEPSEGGNCKRLARNDYERVQLVSIVFVSGGAKEPQNPIHNVVERPKTTAPTTPAAGDE